MSKNQRPNILFIQADQMQSGVLPAYGHPLVKTPHLDSLAENGVVFENCYTNYPLCVPSRMSMLTGQYANSIDSWDNAAELYASTPTVAHYLRLLGYHTVLCGKMHFIGPDQVHGFNERTVTDIYPSNFAWTPDWIAGEKYRPTGINLSAVKDAGVCVRSLQIDYDDEVEHSGMQKLYDLARFSSEKPFFLTVSFTHPHSPYICKQEYWDLYDHDEIDMPKVPAIPVEEQDVMSKWLHYAHGGDLHNVTDEDIRNARHGYYGNCTYIDDKVGNLMKVLKETGLDENTVIIFSADHGDMIGERGAWYKQYFYEGSTSIPFIMSYPKKFSQRRVPNPISLVDLMPTILDFATDEDNQVEVVSPQDGNSLVGLASGSTDWDDTVISEYTGEGVVEPCRMIRKGKYKYNYVHNNPSQLYDLEADPLEVNDLIDSPEHQDIIKQLHEEVLDGWDAEWIKKRCIQTQKERFVVQRSTEGLPTWGYNVPPTNDQKYIRNAGAVQTKALARYPFVEPTPFIK